MEQRKHTITYKNNESCQENKDFLVPGALVFGKVRGYSPWPARIEEIVKHNVKPDASYYRIFFYYSHQIAVCRGSDLYDYWSTKEKHSKCKAYGFLDAIHELETNPDIKKLTSTSLSNQGSHEIIEPIDTTINEHVRAEVNDANQQASLDISTGASKERTQYTVKIQDDNGDPKILAVDELILHKVVKPCFVSVERLAIGDATTVNLSQQKTSSKEKPRKRKLARNNNVNMKFQCVYQELETMDLKNGNSCMFCEQNFQNFNFVINHVQSIHGKYPYCKFCEKFFHSEARLMEHLNECANSDAGIDNNFCCFVCDRTFENVNKLQRHKQIHSSNIYQNEIYNSDIYKLDIINKIQNFLEQFSMCENFIIHCITCKCDLTTNAYFETHIERFPDTKKCVCPLCGENPSKFSDNLVLFLEHILAHFENADLQLINCRKCGNILANNYSQIIHTFNNHSRVYDCTVEVKAGPSLCTSGSVAIETGWNLTYNAAVASEVETTHVGMHNKTLQDDVPFVSLSFESKGNEKKRTSSSILPEMSKCNVTNNTVYLGAETSNIQITKVRSINTWKKSFHQM